MRRLPTLLTICAVLALITAGCSDDDQPDSTGTTTGSNSSGAPLCADLEAGFKIDTVRGDGCFNEDTGLVVRSVENECSSSGDVLVFIAPNGADAPVFFGPSGGKALEGKTSADYFAALETC